MAAHIGRSGLCLNRSLCVSHPPFYKTRRDVFVLLVVTPSGTLNTVIPRLTKIIRSGITFVSRNLR